MEVQCTIRVTPEEIEEIKTSYAQWYSEPMTMEDIEDCLVERLIDDCADYLTDVKIVVK